jgi:hypothetical protein
MARVMLVVALVFVLAACNPPTQTGSPSPTPASSVPPSGEACVPGPAQTDGVQVHSFCGPASVSVTIRGETHELAGGECGRTGDSFFVNVGTLALGDLDPKPDYFGLSVGDSARPVTGDGKFNGANVSGVFGGNDFAMATDGSVKLTGGLTAGQFSGDDLEGGGTLTGNFSCG